MTIGTGIAIAGIWMLPVACAMSKSVSGAGLIIGCMIALAGTGLIAGIG